MTRFEGKICLVTGASRGIGYATAQRLAKEGATIITAQRQKSDHHHSYPCDLSQPEVCADLIDHIIRDHGRLDVLVNNAGLMSEAPLDKMSLELWDKTIALNLTTPFWLMAKALPYLAEHKGAIVNIGSIEGLGANPGHSAYCASKGGLHALTKAAAVDAGPMGVRVNAIAPGWVDTELNNDFIEQMPDPASFRKQIAKIHPLGKTGAPDEIASLAAFLASDDASFITGQIITIDGGRLAQLPLP